MATNSTNMSLPIPTVSVDYGPGWAQNVDASLTIIDSHNHAPGYGVPINPSGININADLPFNNTNNITSLRSVRFTPTSIPATSPDLGCVYVSGVDLYYNDENGNVIQMTSSGSVNAGAGSISGLPSGTASATYVPVSGTFQWQQATSTAANMDAATLIVRYPGSYPTPTGNYVALQASSSLATGYSLTLPVAVAAASGSFLTSSSAGVLSYTVADNSTLIITTGSLGVKANSLTGTQMANNINLPGNLVQENGKNVVVSNTNASASLAIVRGYSISNAVTAGEGWTLTHNSLGNYTVTFSSVFADTACVAITPVTNGAAMASIYSIGSNAFSFQLFTNGGSLIDVPFTFVAVGKRV